MSEPAQEMLSLPEVCRFFGGAENPLDKSTIYRWVRTGKLAKPLKLGDPGGGWSSSRWLRSDCQRTLDAMIAEQRPATVSEEA